MEKYIEEALAASFILPLTSPAADGFFFVEKKDSGLQPCIDYRGLNSITVSYSYPLPLVPAAIQQLREVHVIQTHTSAPAVFQAFINEILKGFINRYIIGYINDILIYSLFYDKHVCHVHTVLSRLLQHRLYVKAEKCKFHKDSITFLGYIILQKGVEMDTSKVRTVTDWPEPTTIKELQRFVGFTNFYHLFIRNYSCVASPLTSPLRGKPR
ncbi:hypothetical protein QTP86_022528 [Hemibagrus guttatus]|nr:hypothetical protein QTP86_022528 [Hemibagrus guttatus]